MTTELTVEQRAAWREALIAEVTGTADRCAGGRRATWRGVSATIAAAGVIGVAVAAVAVVQPTDNVPTPGRAPALLNAAAQVTLGDPTPGPGEYLLVRTRADYVGADGAGNGYVSSELHETFLPADHSEPVIKRTTYLRPTVFFGPGGAELAARDWAAQQPKAATEGPKVVVEQEIAPPAPEPLPREPRQLLDRLRGRDNPAGLPVDQFLFHQLADLLRAGDAPAEVRAVAYRALALVPGIRVATKEIVLDGSSGTAFALAGDGFPSTEQVVIDPRDGRYLGERLVLNQADGAIPRGTLLESTAVTTRVVGAAPKPTTTVAVPAQLPRR